MLHLNTIDENTHQTLTNLQLKDYLQQFALVRDTNLSLRFGHRASIVENFSKGLTWDKVKKYLKQIYSTPL